jgi:hypothetical protein
MVPVSSIFLQENRFSPLPSGLFFCPFSARLPRQIVPADRYTLFPRIFHPAEYRFTSWNMLPSNLHLDIPLRKT